LFIDDYQWEVLDSSRKICYINDFIVIKPKLHEKILPIYCMLCYTMVRGIEDVTEMKKFNTCRACADKWVYINYESWSTGWRPSNNDINDELKNRKKNPVFQISLKEDI